MKKQYVTALILTMALFCQGCGNADTPDNFENNPGTTNSTSDNQTSNQTGSITLSDNASDYFTDRDLDSSYEAASAAFIQLSGSTAQCSSDAVQIDGSTVTILDEGTYILTGTLDNGMIIVNADKSDKTQLVLDNVTISSDTCAPIYIKQADKVFLTLAPDSENTLSNGGSFTAIDDNNIDAVIFSKEDLTLNGTGKLTVTSPAGHGIVSKDELTVTDGTYELNTASHGLSGKDNICVANASLSIVSGKDGLHAENNDDASLGFVYIDSGVFQITAEGDGISAASDMLIQNGTFDIVTGGGSVNAAQQSSDFWGTMPEGGRGGHMGGPGSMEKPDESMGGPGSMGKPDDAMGNPDSMGKPGSATGSMDKPGGDAGSWDKPNDSMHDDVMPGDNESGTEDSTSIKGIKSTGVLQINNGSFTIDSADDAIHSNSNLVVNGGSFTIKTGDDGFHADVAFTINNGNISISECYEGLEGLCMDIFGGTISVVASDDGLNAAGGTDQSGMGGPRGNDMFATDKSSYINIAGGTLYLNATGDGIDSNGYLTMTDGSVVVSGPNWGDTAVLDYGIEATITGGTFIGTGASQMNTNFSSSSTQGALLVNVGTLSAGTLVELSDSTGKVLVSRETDQDFSSIIISCPALQKGSDYTLTIGSDSIDFTMKELVYSARTTK